MRLKTWARFPVRLTPSTLNIPAVGATIPLMTLKSVVLPAPFGPMMPMSSAGPTRNVTPDNAEIPPKRTVRPLNSTSASDMLAPSAPHGAQPVQGHDAC